MPGQKNIARVYMDVSERWRWNLADFDGNIFADSTDSYLTRDEAKASLDKALMLSEEDVDIVLEPIPPDSSGPRITISEPLAGASLTGTVAVKVLAEDPAGISDVALFIDERLADYDLVAPMGFNVDTKFLSNGKHTLGIRATDKLGNQGRAEVEVTVMNPPPPPPPPPIGNPGAVTDLKAEADGTIVLTWKAPASGGAVDRYHVERKGDLVIEFVEIGTLSGLEFVDAVTLPEIEYTYRVRAHGVNGEFGEFSNQASAKRSGPPPPPPPPDGAPGAVLGLVAEAKGDGTSTVKLMWEAPIVGGAVDMYHIERKDVTGPDLEWEEIVGHEADLEALMYEDTGAMFNTTYLYRVSAHGINGVHGPFSNEASVITPDAPTPAARARARRR